MIEAFKAIRFKPTTLALIGHDNGIIGEYQALGFILTLRQLFYQFVSRPTLGLANTFDDYKRLGRTVTDPLPVPDERVGGLSRHAQGLSSRGNRGRRSGRCLDSLPIWGPAGSRAPRPCGRPRRFPGHPASSDRGN
jgi:hypothetical protein